MSKLKIKRADFIKAMKLVEKHGLTYGMYGAEGGPRCTLGHLKTVTENRAVHDQFGFDGDKIAHAIGFNFYEATRFNDGDNGPDFPTDPATKDEGLAVRIIVPRSVVTVHSAEASGSTTGTRAVVAPRVGAHGLYLGQSFTVRPDLRGSPSP